MKRQPSHFFSEQQFTDAFAEAANALGWLVHHDRPARTNTGWRTAIQGDPGFPDFLIAHPKHRRAAYIELKSGKAKVRPNQKLWLETLKDIQLSDTFVWRSEDWARGLCVAYLQDPDDIEAFQP